MDYDIFRPWLTLDPWQKEYIESPPEQDCFLLTGRQSGKTTAMSIKAVELCTKKFKKGEFVLINSITEKQAYHMLTKALIYAKEKYKNQIILKGKEKPTLHKLLFKNGTGILCYAAGETGEGIRGFTIKKLMCDEGSRMSDEYFIAAMPMLSVIKGSMDIASTPFGKHNKDGSEKFFYKCSKDEGFKKFYISGEDCPRHSQEFLEQQKERMSKLAYAQEYLAMFTDEFKRVFDEEIIKNICVLKRGEKGKGMFFLGVDVAGMGGDECTYEVLKRDSQNFLEQKESIIEKRNYTTDTTRKILELDKPYNFKQIGVDDGGVGFGVFSELMNLDSTKRRTEALNNSSRKINKDGSRSKKILKEEMYINLLTLMETGKIKLLDDDEVKTSLASIQHEDGKIYGSYSHIAEGLIRAAWLAAQNKHLNIFVRTF